MATNRSTTVRRNRVCEAVCFALAGIAGIAVFVSLSAAVDGKLAPLAAERMASESTFLSNVDLYNEEMRFRVAHRIGATTKRAAMTDESRSQLPPDWLDAMYQASLPAATVEPLSLDEINAMFDAAFDIRMAVIHRGASDDE